MQRAGRVRVVDADSARSWLSTRRAVTGDTLAPLRQKERRLKDDDQGGQGGARRQSLASQDIEAPSLAEREVLERRCVRTARPARRGEARQWVCVVKSHHRPETRHAAGAACAAILPPRASCN